jgi:predicted secreted protein
MYTRELTSIDNGARIVVPVPSEVIVRLPASMAGYRWHIEVGDRAWLQIVDADVEVSEAARHVPGAPAVHTFVLLPQRPGETDMVFAQYRDWEGSASAGSRFSITIVAEAAMSAGGTADGGND